MTSCVCERVTLCSSPANRRPTMLALASQLALDQCVRCCRRRYAPIGEQFVDATSHDARVCKRVFLRAMHPPPCPPRNVAALSIQCPTICAFHPTHSPHVRERSCFAKVGNGVKPTSSLPTCLREEGTAIHARLNVFACRVGQHSRHTSHVPKVFRCLVAWHPRHVHGPTQAEGCGEEGV